MMQFSVVQIAGLISAEIEGDVNANVSSFNNIEAAKEGDLSFLANPKYEGILYTSRATAVIVSKNLVLKQPTAATLLRVEDPYAAFATLLKVYQDMQAQSLKGIEAHTQIAESAQIGKEVYIGSFTYLSNNVVVGDNTKIYPGCYIGDKVTIGENSIIYPGVKIYHDCVIGSNVIIHSGAVIGADGFGFAPQADGSYQKIPQIGNVIIEDDVEIGANTSIDRATLNSTIIKKGVKLDNLVQIAHNVYLGENSAMAAQSGISGSTIVGRNVMIAGQAGIAGHIELADQTIITAQSGVAKTIKDKNKILTGSPAFNHKDARRSDAIFRKLPDLYKKIEALERRVKELSKQ